MAGYRDDSAGDYGTWSNEGLSWDEWLRAKSSDAKNALSALGTNLAEAASPFSMNAYGQPSLQVPPMISAPVSSLGRLVGADGHPTMFNTRYDDQAKGDALNVLFGIYGGNAAAAMNPLRGGAKALAMDEASRMARAADMGFDTTTPIYHGSRNNPKPFDAFDLSKKGQGTDYGWFGEGVYTTPSEWRGSNYAGETGHVREMYGRMRNPFEWRAGEPHAADYLRSIGVDLKSIPQAEKGAAITKALKEQGYDGVNVKYPGGDAVQEQVFFNPANLRDVNAAFDPARAGENGLLLSDTGKPSMFGSAVAGASERPFDYHRPFKDVDGQIIDYFRSSRDLLRKTNEDGFDPDLLDQIQQHGIGSEKIDKAITNRDSQGNNLLEYYADRATDYASSADEINDMFQSRYERLSEANPQFTNHTAELPDSNLDYLDEYANSGPSASRKLFNHLDGLDGIFSKEIANLTGHYANLSDPPVGSLDNILESHFGTLDQHQANAQYLGEMANQTSDYAGIFGSGYKNWNNAVERRSNALEAIRDKLRDRLSDHDIDALFSDTGKPSILGSAIAGAGEQRAPVKAYHSTPAQFDKFDNAFTDELGFHFGSKTQAHNRAYVQSGGNPLEYFFKWRDIPVEMDIKKPAAISQDVGKFDGQRMAQQLVRDGVAPYDLIPQVMSAPKEARNSLVRDWLVSNGYDAVKYPNQFEGVGDPSYMALGTGNVRHAKTGEVLYTDNLPSPFGAAAASAGEQDLPPWLKF